MSAIEASSVNVRTLVDGTLRITVDVEPRHAKDAFALFGAPGIPMALAALKPASHTKEDKLKGGLLSQWCAMRCGEADFQRWISREFSGERFHVKLPMPDADRCAAVVRMVCKINSRAELDNDEAAEKRFNELIRHPWQKQWAAVNA
jgi:hypothetical protein